MLKKGFRKVESPEKMPVLTTGIDMTGEARDKQGREELTGGNAAADESQAAKMVTDYIARSNR